RSYPEFDPVTTKLGPATELATMVDLRELPRNVVVADLDRNGADDMLVFFEYAPPGVLRQGSDGTFEKLEPAGLLAGLVASTNPGNFSTATLAGMESSTILVSRDEFVRAFHLDESGVAD